MTPTQIKTLIDTNLHMYSTLGDLSPDFVWGARHALRKLRVDIDRYQNLLNDNEPTPYDRLSGIEETTQ